MPMKEILTVDRINSLIRIPKFWIEENLPPGDKVQVIREFDQDKIIISPLREQTNVPKNRRKNNNT